MFKGVLCLILIFACGGLGMIKAQTYSQRYRELSDLKDMLRMLQTEMNYLKDPLPVIFARISSYKENSATDLLQECSFRMTENLDFCKCWEEAAILTYRGSCLNRQDMEVVKDLGLQLGKSNIQGQHSIFSLTEAKLDIQIAEAEKEKATKGKMYRGLGFSAGIILAVILI